uniref:uncharacterized protein LOC120345803 isoform X2 n=1 Tax=Styela clava TaxID=7725 RepID=UPI00193AB181|nr:uncharacterized protein LOC120345803 isoform X2 [Styela clava]
MGCSSSKDAVQAITVEDGVVKPASGKARKIKVNETKSSYINENDAIHITMKSSSAKSRDSGIDEMDSDIQDGIITETSDPHRVSEIEGNNRPETPDLSLAGHQFSSNSASRERLRSKVILEELESQGLISSAKVQTGGAAFEVGGGSAVVLEPLSRPPLPRPPPRLEKLKHEGHQTLTKEELDLKQKQAEFRRQKSMHKPKRRSRLASQLAKDREMANDMNHEDKSVDPEDGSPWTFDESEIDDPFKTRHEIPHE